MFFFGHFRKLSYLCSRICNRHFWSLASAGCQTLFRIVLWCNGSTRVFGSLSPGSNPGSTTREKIPRALPSPFLTIGLVAQLVRATDS